MKEVAQSRPHGLQPTRLLRPWDFPGKSTGVGCHCLLWGLLQQQSPNSASAQLRPTCAHSCHVFKGPSICCFGEGNGNPLQYSCLENPTGGGAWWAASPWVWEESDVTERLLFHFLLSCTGEGNGNPLQCSCLENLRDGGTWWADVYGVAQSRTRLK